MINAQLLQMVIDASNDGIVIAEKEGEHDNILIYVQVKAQQRVAQLEAQVAELQAELAALKPTNGANKTEN